MKIDRKKLVDALEIAEPALCTNPLIPAFQHFHIKGNRVVTTDGVMIIDSFLEDDTKIECMIPGIPFLHLVKSLKEDTIELAQEGGNLCVRTNEIKGSFALVDIDYTVDVSVDKVDWLECSKLFLDGLNYCRHNVSSDATSVLGGVCIRGNAIYGTDRYRIMRYRLPEYIYKKDDFFVLPVKFVNTILSIRERITHIGLHTETKKFVARLDNMSCIATGFSTEDYPDLDEHLGIELDDFQKIEFPKETIDVLNRHIDFQKASSEEMKRIDIKIEKKDCTITTTEPDLGVLVESMGIPTEISAPVEFTVNPLFLKDILKITSGFWCCPEKYVVLFLTENLEATVKTIKQQTKD